MNTRCLSIAIGAGLAASATAQMSDSHLGAAGGIVASMKASQPGGHLGPRGPIVASLTYDGVSRQGVAGQDFETPFDVYDVYCCETFSISDDANLGEFRSKGFSNTGNPFGMTDVIVEIYDIAQLGEICDDDELPDFLLRSVPGTGFWDGEAVVGDFGGQCLPAGEYVLRWAAELDYSFGRTYFFTQHGAHDNGGGAADDAFQNNPGQGIGMGVCFGPTDEFGELSGINFVLGGTPGDCEPGCNDTIPCGDWDGDGDSDGDDFFGFLDGFATGDECADLDGDGDHDGDDFFGFLDRFVNPC